MPKTDRPSKPHSLLAKIAAAKSLPLAFLEELGVRHLRDGSVGISYRGFGGEEIAIKTRTALIAKEGSYWPKGQPLSAYGDWRIGDARKAGYLIFVEGESDSWALWFDSFPALGLPGAGAAKTVEAEHLESIERCYVVQEPGQGGGTFIKGVGERLGTLGFSGSAFVIKMGALGHKDPAAMRVVNPGTFRQRFQAALDDAEQLDLLNSFNSLDGARGGINSIDLIDLTPPTLPEEAHHGLVGQFLRAVSPYTEATDAGVLAHLLSAVGMLVGPGPHVWAGGRQPARVFTAIVGPTSTGRKGTSFAPVNELMIAVDRVFWQTQCVGGLSSGEGLIVKVADICTKDPETKQVEVEPVEKRLFVLEPEFSRILANIRREGNVLSQIIREGFDTGNLATLTVNPRQAAGAHICLVAHITPEELSARLNQIEMANGFGNRFLWFAVKSNKVMPKTAPIPAEVFSEFVPRLQSLRSLPECNVDLSDMAKPLWEQIYPELRKDHPGLVGAMIARRAGIVLRLALIYRLLDLDPLTSVSERVGAKEIRNRQLKQRGIQVEHLNAALAVWDYCEASARMLFGDKSGNPLADRLYQLLANGPMNAGEFFGHTNQPADAIRSALTYLERSGRVRMTKVHWTGRGRPAERWERIK
jgi:hypothetical protein